MVLKQGEVLPQKKAEFSNFWRKHEEARCETPSLNVYQKLHQKENEVYKNMLMLNAKIYTVRE